MYRANTGQHNMCVYAVSHMMYMLLKAIPLEMTPSREAQQGWPSGCRISLLRQHAAERAVSMNTCCATIDIPSGILRGIKRYYPGRAKSFIRSQVRNSWEKGMRGPGSNAKEGSSLPSYLFYSLCWPSLCNSITKGWYGHMIRACSG